jgi:HSP20 family protein
MTNKMKVETTEKVRQVSPARVNSKARGRPIADLVEKFEGTGSLKSLSSAALRAGDFIRTMRKAGGMSQAELANKIGVSQSRISEIEAGMGSQGPTWDVMERIATAFGKRWQIADEQLAAEDVRLPAKIEDVRLPAKIKDMRHRLFEEYASTWRQPSFPRLFFDQSFGRAEPMWPSVPAVDIAETEQAYEITAELPNTDAKNIEVSFVHGVLSIKGEKPQEEIEQKGKEYYLSERSFGSFQRAFRVPEDIDSNKIEATFKNGVLTVTLPKPAGSHRLGKRIAITTSILGKEG